MIDQWIGGEGRKILMEQYGIDAVAYRPSGKVVPIGRKRKRADEGGR
jgi:hypothetical protein